MAECNQRKNATRQAHLRNAGIFRLSQSANMNCDSADQAKQAELLLCAHRPTAVTEERIAWYQAANTPLSLFNPEDKHSTDI
jgi:hypothetical protein